MGRTSLIAVAVAAAAITFVAASGYPAPASDGLTKWDTSGKGDAIGRGWLGSPSVSVESTTLRDPEKVRFVLRGTAPDVRVSWSMTCFNANDSTTRRVSGNRDNVSLPFRRSLGGKWVGTFDFCNLRVFAFSIDEGAIKLKLQARYSN